MTAGDSSVPGLPWDHLPAPVRRVREQSKPRPKASAGRRAWDASSLSSVAADPEGWVGHHLTAQGPAPSIDRLCVAARGPGLIPWVLNVDRQEEDLFALLSRVPAARRGMAVRECHALAHQLAQSAARARAMDLTRAAEAVACPFDLNRLLPVPPALLEAGENDPDTLAWLRKHWGVAATLRRVVSRARPSPLEPLAKSHAVVGWGFYSRGGSPFIAIARLRRVWPDLTFRLDVNPAV
ncbi:hypothetical protein LWC05_14410 [Acetobacter sicerae]|uniref:Uncharacterized protein n=1 Tax=Acetobacter sicerae TaxID=85325 RepID=A0ABS8VVQ5_9PROT|nr:hypothetical protein [Acetobacter sicerae]MCE0745067.1 hypothetical protein [Acetobacter sicerae]